MIINSLIESIRLEVSGEQVAIYNLTNHLSRLKLSAKELNFSSCCSEAEVLEAVQDFFPDHQVIEVNDIPGNKTRQKIFKLRLLLHRTHFETRFQPYPRSLNKAFTIKLLSTNEFHINSSDRQWRYKFLPREDFSQYFLRYFCDELIWTNERQEVCEGSFTNIFIKNSSGQWITPSLESNLIAGTMRQKVIKLLGAQEVTVSKKDLLENEEIILTNALIGMVIAKLV